MSQDRPDDPLAPRDVTILRPRPGAGRKPAAPAPQSPPPVQPSAPPPAAYAPAPTPPPPQPAQFAMPANAELLAQLPGVAVNPLVQAAVPLLLLAGRLRGQIAPADVEALRRQTMQEINSFEDRARRVGIPPEDVLAARYALCTVVDEAVLNTPWGAQGGWASQSLLVTFHREASGGEKFFQILDRVSGEPQRYLALLELLYVCLALGFEGKYRLDPQGAARLAEIRQNLYRRIEGLRDGVEPELSPRWKGVEDRRNAVMRFVPLWIVAAACAVVLLGGYLYFDSQLRAKADPLNATLAGVGLESFDTPAVATPAPSSGLRELLATQIASGQIYFDEAGGRTAITLAVPDLFASGSTQVNDRHASLVHAIGAALNQVPGRVVVIGHTDNQPLRSLRFKDNYELSRARAEQVAALLMKDIHSGARIETAGKGALEPRFEPADLPENRARNRRVEIIHRRDG
ncbi:MAG TPA: type IVB secretion system protein IcmH/DotU [Steroidobacter sp.]|uniref:type IVB secretion system protein IcmH/DotU n=1 Tax=Steroidobacter sp. TaxID=1978227 RepID=UPI002EDB76A2